MDVDAMKRVLVMSALEALAWLTAKVARYATDYVWVTPEIAAAWLTKNTRNREPINSNIEECSRQMGDGRWITEATTIDFGEDGTLYNGQHRLMAVVKGKHSVEMKVRRNCPIELLRVLDTGIIRNATQILKIEFGIAPDTRKRAATTCAARMIAFGNTMRGTRHTRDSLKAALDEFGADYESVFDALKRDSGRLSNGGLLGSLVIAYRSNPKSVERFASELHDGAELKAGSPVLTLRDRVLGLRDVGGGGIRDEISRMTFSALDAYIRGERRLSIRITNEASRERFIEAWKKASGK